MEDWPIRASFDNLHEEEGVAGRKSLYVLLRSACTAAHPLSAVSQIPAAKMERPVYSDTKEFIRSRQRKSSSDMSSLKQAASQSQLQSNVFTLPNQSVTAFACPTLFGCQKKRLVDKLS